MKTYQKPVLTKRGKLSLVTAARSGVTGLMRSSAARHPADSKLQRVDSKLQLVDSSQSGRRLVLPKRAGAVAMKKAYEKPVLVKRQKLSSVVASPSIRLADPKLAIRNLVPPLGGRPLAVRQTEKPSRGAFLVRGSLVSAAPGFRAPLCA